jgi:hypothetical protein
MGNQEIVSDDLPVRYIIRIRIQGRLVLRNPAF